MNLLFDKFVKGSSGVEHHQSVCSTHAFNVALSSYLKLAIRKFSWAGWQFSQVERHPVLNFASSIRSNCTCQTFIHVGVPNILLCQLSKHSGLSPQEPIIFSWIEVNLCHFCLLHPHLMFLSTIISVACEFVTRKIGTEQLKSVLSRWILFHWESFKNLNSL